MTEILTEPREQMIRTLLDLPDGQKPMVMALAVYETGYQEPHIIISRPPQNENIPKLNLLKKYINCFNRINQVMYVIRKNIYSEMMSQ